MLYGIHYQLAMVSVDETPTQGKSIGCSRWTLTRRGIKPMLQQRLSACACSTPKLVSERWRWFDCKPQSRCDGRITPTQHVPVEGEQLHVVLLVLQTITCTYRRSPEVVGRFHVAGHQHHHPNDHSSSPKVVRTPFTASSALFVASTMSISRK